MADTTDTTMDTTASPAPTQSPAQPAAPAAAPAAAVVREAESGAMSHNRVSVHHGGQKGKGRKGRKGKGKGKGAGSTSMLSKDGKINHIIIDTAAFIRGVRLENMAKNFWTIPEVIQEVKDARARAVLDALPFDLQIREPSRAAIQFIVDFARKTGDLHALSVPDIKVLALTYQMELEHTDGTHLRKEPRTTTADIQRSINQTAAGAGAGAGAAAAAAASSAGATPPVPPPSAATATTAAAPVASSVVKVPKKPFSWGAPPAADAVASRDGGTSGVSVSPIRMRPTQAPAPASGSAWGSKPAADAEGAGESKDSEPGVALDEDAFPTFDEVRDQMDVEPPIEVEIAAAPKGSSNNLWGSASAAGAGAGAGAGAMSETGTDKATTDTEAAAAASSSAAAKPSKRVTFGSRILTGGGAGVAAASAQAAAEDDGSGWIGPDTLKSGGVVRSGATFGGWGSGVSIARKAPIVGCCTTDFTMQNVIMHVGMSLVSLQGRAVTRVKQWVLKCDSCFHITSDMSKLFCPKCGNATMARLGATIGKNGKVHYHYKKNRRVNTRGTQWSMPKPKGGREGPMLVSEDQLMVGVWKQRAQKKQNIDSFFGGAAMELGHRRVKGADVVVGVGRRNPNARKGRERRGQKKKKQGRRR